MGIASLAPPRTRRCVLFVRRRDFRFGAEDLPCLDSAGRVFDPVFDARKSPERSPLWLASRGRGASGGSSAGMLICLKRRVFCEESVSWAGRRHGAYGETEIAVCIPPASPGLTMCPRFMLRVRWIAASPLPRACQIAVMIPTEYQTHLAFNPAGPHPLCGMHHVHGTGCPEALAEGNLDNPSSIEAGQLRRSRAHGEIIRDLVPRADRG